MDNRDWFLLLGFYLLWVAALFLLLQTKVVDNADPDEGETDDSYKRSRPKRDDRTERAERAGGGHDEDDTLY